MCHQSGKQLKRQGQLSSKAHVISLEMANQWTFGVTPGYHGSKDLFQLQNMKPHPSQPLKVSQLIDPNLHC